MAIDRLVLYNIALSAIGERTLSSVTENVESRRILDEVWNRGSGAVKFFLEQGLWNFAIRAVKIDSDSSIDPEFGFTYAFGIPADFVRLASIGSGEYFGDPDLNYEFEGEYIYTDVDPLYMRYVSDDEDWGADFSRWPQTFINWAGYWLATQIAPRLKNDLDMERLEKRADRYLVDARSKDALQEPVRYQPLSSWASARYGTRYGRRDRGKRNRLTG